MVEETVTDDFRTFSGAADPKTTRGDRLRPEGIQGVVDPNATTNRKQDVAY